MGLSRFGLCFQRVEVQGASVAAAAGAHGALPSRAKYPCYLCASWALGACEGHTSPNKTANKTPIRLHASFAISQASSCMPLSANSFLCSTLVLIDWLGEQPAA